MLQISVTRSGENGVFVMEYIKELPVIIESIQKLKCPLLFRNLGKNASDATKQYLL